MALTTSFNVLHGHIDSLTAHLFPPLETFYYVVLLWLNSSAAIEATPVFLALALAGMLSWITYRHTGSLICAAVPLAVISFSRVFWDQIGLLTFYPAFALLGYAGLYSAGTYILRSDASLKWAIAAGVFLTLALCSFTTALLFIPVPGLLLLFYWTRPRFQRALVCYIAIAAISAPWLLWHVIVAGQHFYYHPYVWFTIKYLPIVNGSFWDYPQNSVVHYLPRILHLGFSTLLSVKLWPAMPLGFIALWRWYGSRSALFAATALLYFIATLAVIRPAPYERYFYPILPAVILLASAGLILIWQLIARSAHVRLLLAVQALALLFYVVLTGYSPGAVTLAQARYVRSTTVGRAGLSDAYAIKEIIGSSSSGVLARDSRLQSLLLKNPLNTIITMKEADYVTYLKWQNEAAVLDVMKRNNIGWVLLYKDTDKWERDYNLWLNQAYGAAPQHYLELPHSNNFREVYAGKFFNLYQVVSYDYVPIAPPAYVLPAGPQPPASPIVYDVASNTVLGADEGLWFSDDEFQGFGTIGSFLARAASTGRPVYVIGDSKDLNQSLSDYGLILGQPNDSQLAPVISHSQAACASAACETAGVLATP